MPKIGIELNTKEKLKFDLFAWRKTREKIKWQTIRNTLLNNPKKR